MFQGGLDETIIFDSRGQPLAPRFAFRRTRNLGLSPFLAEFWADWMSGSL